MKINELKAEIIRNGMTIEKFADLVGIGRTTLWRRFDNPDDFTLGEITKMAEVLKIGSNRIEEIFFNNKVS